MFSRVQRSPVAPSWYHALNRDKQPAVMTPRASITHTRFSTCTRMFLSTWSLRFAMVSVNKDANHVCVQTCTEERTGCCKPHHLVVNPAQHTLHPLSTYHENCCTRASCCAGRKEYQYRVPGGGAPRQPAVPVTVIPGTVYVRKLGRGVAQVEEDVVGTVHRGTDWDDGSVGG